MHFKHPFFLLKNKVWNTGTDLTPPLWKFQSFFNPSLRHINSVNMVGEYDICSIMHYVNQFIVPKKCETWNCADCPDCYYCDIGLTRPNFTEQDVQKINLYYGCNEIGKLHYVTLPTDGMWTVVAFT